MSQPAGVNSYDRHAPTPKVGTHWVWEIDKPHARQLVEVVEVTWNGEEWWVLTRRLLGGGMASAFPEKRDAMNDLGRFWKAVTPVGWWSSKSLQLKPSEGPR